MDKKIAKKTQLYLFFLCVFNALTVCSQEKQMAPYLVYVNEIIQSTVKEMHAEYGLECMGSGGKMPHDVEEIDIMFVMFDKVTIEEARRLGLAGVQKLVKKVNNHNDIRKYLHEYPFTNKNVWIAISFYDKKGNYHKNNVATVGFLNDKVVYTQAEIHKVQDPGLICGKTGKYIRQPKVVEDETLVTILRETYEEAEAIVEKEKRSM